MEAMTDRQYDGILQMIGMILEGCEDIEEARAKIAELRKEKKKRLNKSAGTIKGGAELPPPLKIKISVAD